MARSNEIVGHYINDRLTCTSCSHALGLETGDREVTRWDVEPSDTCEECKEPMHPEAQTYTIGNNMPGYMPDSEPFTVVGTFDDAKRALIDELKLAEDYANSEEEAEEYSEAAEDVNLWSSPDTIRVGNLVYWIH